MDTSRFARLVAVAINPDGVEINAQVFFRDPCSFFLSLPTFLPYANLLRPKHNSKISDIASSPIISAVYP
jgi:hypothetical protein